MADKTQRNVDLENTRLEVVYLLRSILQEVTIQAEGGPRPLEEAAKNVIRLYERLVHRVTFVAAPPAQF